VVRQLARRCCLVLGVSIVLCSIANAGLVQLNFSGGNGAQLFVSVAQGVQYVVTNDTANPGVSFVFRDVGDLTGGNVALAGGNITYLTNSVSPLTIDTLRTGPTTGVIDANDLSLFHSGAPGVNLGDRLNLGIGSLITNGAITASAPPSGLYEAILVDSAGVQLAVGNVVPEPSTMCTVFSLALLALRKHRVQS